MAGLILQILTFLECVVLSLTLYMLIQLLPSISVNSGFYNTLPLFSLIVGE